jgi:hypothetical protein
MRVIESADRIEQDSLLLSQALRHSDAVESILILSFIERAGDVRNDVFQFHDAINERLASKS